MDESRDELALEIHEALTKALRLSVRYVQSFGPFDGEETNCFSVEGGKYTARVTVKPTEYSPAQDYMPREVVKNRGGRPLGSRNKVAK